MEHKHIIRWTNLDQNGELTALSLGKCIDPDCPDLIDEMMENNENT
jgi:hypothetical protein